MVLEFSVCVSGELPAVFSKFVGLDFIQWFWSSASAYQVSSLGCELKVCRPRFETMVLEFSVCVLGELPEVWAQSL